MGVTYLTKGIRRVLVMGCVKILRQERTLPGRSGVYSFVDPEQGIKASPHLSIALSKSHISLYQQSPKHGQLLLAEKKLKTVN